MKKILFEVFTGNYHSYACVWYFTLKYLKFDDYEILIKKVPFLNNAGYAENEIELFDTLNLREYSGETVDIIVRCVYPYNVKPDPISPDAKIIVFNTCEYSRFDASQFNLSYNEIIKNEKLFFLTPSRKSDCLFKDRSFVLPHGIDPTIYYPKPIKHDTFTFLNISAGSKNKNLPVLISAFYKILKMGIKAKMILKICTDIYINTIPDAIKNLGLENDKLLSDNLTVITGNHTFAEIAALYNSSDCYLSAGCAEAFDLGIAESSSCGLPVICTDLSPQVMKMDSRLLVKTKLGQPIVDNFVLKMKSVVENKSQFKVSQFLNWQQVADSFQHILSEVCSDSVNSQ
jgi:glycosyltransferase involved in cell wall biosynthesis